MFLLLKYLHVRKRFSFEKAKIIAVELGNEALTSVKNNLTQFSEDEISRIKFFSWPDTENTEEYQDVMKFTFDYFESNSDFRKELRGMIMLWTEKVERKFSNEDINIFAKYFLSELPECLDKVKIGGLDCDAYMYPFESTFTDFVYNIQLGNKYKDLRSGIMKYGPKTLIIYN